MNRKKSFLIGVTAALITFGSLVSVFGFRPHYHFAQKGYGHHCKGQKSTHCQKDGVDQNVKPANSTTENL